MFDIGFGTTGRLHVENLASLIETDSGSSERTATLRTLVFSGGLGLLVSLGEGAAEDSGAGYDEGCDDAVSLKTIEISKSSLHKI